MFDLYKKIILKLTKYTAFEGKAAHYVIWS